MKPNFLLLIFCLAIPLVGCSEDDDPAPTEPMLGPQLSLDCAESSSDILPCQGTVTGAETGAQITWAWSAQQQTPYQVTTTSASLRRSFDYTAFCSTRESPFLTTVSLSVSMAGFSAGPITQQYTVCASAGS